MKLDGNEKYKANNYFQLSDQIEFLNNTIESYRADQDIAKECLGFFYEQAGVTTRSRSIYCCYVKEAGRY